MEYRPYLRLRHVFQTDNAWWNFYNKYAPRIRSAVLDTMVKLFACCTPAMGFATFRCEHSGCCHVKHIPFSCKSCSCPSCGNKATEQWVQAQLNVLPVTQWQHITFTMPGEFWPLFASNRELLGRLSSLAAKVCLDWCDPWNFCGSPHSRQRPRMASSSALVHYRWRSESGKEAVLPPLPPLKTRRDTFASPGSSTSKPPIRGAGATVLTLRTVVP